MKTQRAGMDSSKAISKLSRAGRGKVSRGRKDNSKDNRVRRVHNSKVDNNKDNKRASNPQGRKTEVSPRVEDRVARLIGDRWVVAGAITGNYPRKSTNG